MQFKTSVLNFNWSIELNLVRIAECVDTAKISVTESSQQQQRKRQQFK